MSKDINIEMRVETDLHEWLADGVYWLEKLSSIEIPVSKIIEKGKFEKYEYLILSYIEGKDIGLVYDRLKEDDKKEIAKEIVTIQNGYFEVEKVERLWKQVEQLEEYFAGVKPIAYLMILAVKIF